MSKTGWKRPTMRQSPGPRRRSGTERRALLALLLAVLAIATPVAGATPRSHVLLVSLDGLYPEIYRNSAALKVRVPNLERLAREGASADGMQGVFPTATYPSHTTLITGVRPGTHGVVANSIFSPESEPAWYWYADSLRVVCLPQAAGIAGLTVGVSCWPALVGAPWIRWHLPEIWSLGSNDMSSREKVAKWATPGLIAEVERRFGEWTDARFEWGAQDDRITDGAVYLIEAKRPQLLLVHLVEVDHVLHAEGRNAAPALRGFEAADRQIGRMLTAIERAGLRDSTDVVIVGDHGFTNVHTDVRPNVQLVELGLLAAGGARRGEWRALARTTTAAAAIYLGNPNDAAAAKLAREHFEKLAAGRYAGIFTVLDRAALDRYDAFPGAAFGLACEPGYAFSGRDSGEFLAASRSRGMHGYRPEEPSMYAGFIGCGPDFEAGIRVPLLRMIDVAPTLASVLGVDLGPQIQGVVVPGLLRSRGGTESSGTPARSNPGSTGHRPSTTNRPKSGSRTP